VNHRSGVKRGLGLTAIQALCQFKLICKISGRRNGLIPEGFRCLNLLWLKLTAEDATYSLLSLSPRYRCRSVANGTIRIQPKK